MFDDFPNLLSGDTEAREVGEDVTSLKRAVEARLDALSAPPLAAPPRLCAALRHALLAPGKRLRPLLTYLVAEPADNREAAAALDVACAVEMVHTASLVLDDLPCMDDAAMRRRRPTTHIAFGQATAMLASVALLSRAFGVLAELDTLPPSTRAQLATVLSRTVGLEGLVSGQELDVSNAAADIEEAARVNWLKTGVLFAAAAEMGAILRGLDEKRTQAVVLFARHLGLAFQTHDDILDLTATSAYIGKDAGQDHGKLNLPSLLGSAEANLACGEDLLLAQQALAQSGVSTAPIAAMLRHALVPGAVEAS